MNNTCAAGLRSSTFLRPK